MNISKTHQPLVSIPLTESRPVKNKKQRLIACVLMLFVALLAVPASAASLYWVGTNASATVDSPSDGTWNATIPSWNTSGSGATNSIWVASSDAVFGGTGAYSVAVPVTSALAVNTLSFGGLNYMLYSPASVQTITLGATSGVNPIGAGVTVTLTNITLASSQSQGFGSGSAAGGTLILGNNATIKETSSGRALAISGSGTLVSVQTGGAFQNSSTGGSAESINIAAATGANATLSVDGGTVSTAGTAPIVNIGAASSSVGTLTLNSGTFTIGGSSGVLVASGASSIGTNNLNGGIMTVPKISKGASGSLAVFNFNGGQLRPSAANASFMTGLDAAYVLGGGAVINCFGRNITIGQSLLNGVVGTDGGLSMSGAPCILTLTGANTYNGPTIVNNGTLVTTTASIGGGAYTVKDGAVLEVQVNNAGTSLTNSSLTLGTSSTLTCNFTLNGNASQTIPAVVDTGALNLNGTVTVNVTASGLSGASTNLLISYDSISGSGSFVPGTLPTVAGYTVTLVNDTVNKQLQLVVVSTPQPVQWAVGDGNWDITSLNWQPLGGGSATNYTELSVAAFDDSASGSSPITVTLTAGHTPSVVTNNSSKDYIFAGSSYNLTGAPLIKDGTGTLTLDNGGGNLFSSVSINGGTLQIGNGDANGSLGVSSVANNGTLAFKRTDNSLTVANVISGSGAVAQNGSGAVTLSGVNTYSGLTIITNGQLILGNSSAAQNSTVSNNMANGLGFASGITAASVQGLSGTGNITLTNAGSVAVALTVGGAGASSSYGGGLKGGMLTKIGSGTLTFTGNSAVDNLAIGNAAVGGILQVAGGAGLSVGSGPASLLLIGISDASARSGTLDASSAATFTANVGTLQVGNAAGLGTGQGILNLATNNTITAATAVSVARSDNTFNSVNSTVTTPGGSTTAIQTPSMTIGDGKGRGFFTLGSGSTLNVAGISGGRAVLNVGSTSIAGGSGGWSGSLDASAGIFNGSLSSLVVGLVNAGSGASQTEAATMTLSANAANHLDISGAGNVMMIGRYQQGTSVNAAVGTLTIGNLDASSQVVSTDNSTAILIGTGGSSTKWTTGTLNLNGGTLLITTTGTGIGGDMANNANNVSVLNLNGVKLKAGASSATFISGLTTANVMGNGVGIDDGGFGVTIPQSLLMGDGLGGGLTKLGAGTLMLNGANTYTGNTTVSNGTLLINGSIAGNAVVATNGLLDGTGTIGGSATVNVGGTLAAGASAIGSLTINGNLTLNGNIAVAVNESLSPSNNLCIVNGSLNNAGTGTVTVTNLGPALSVGDTFTLFSQPLPNGGNLTIVPPDGVTFTNRLADNGSIQVLSVFSTASNPTNITFSVSGSTLNLTWPGDHLGWIAQSNSVTLTDTNYWFDITGSENGTNLVITMQPGKTNVFYRLRHP